MSVYLFPMYFLSIDFLSIQVVLTWVHSISTGSREQTIRILSISSSASVPSPTNELPSWLVEEIKKIEPTRVSFLHGRNCMYILCQFPGDIKILIHFQRSLLLVSSSHGIVHRGVKVSNIQIDVRIKGDSAEETRGRKMAKIRIQEMAEEDQEDDFIISGDTSCNTKVKSEKGIISPHSIDGFTSTQSPPIRPPQSLASLVPNLVKISSWNCCLNTRASTSVLNSSRTAASSFGVQNLA